MLLVTLMGLDLIKEKGVCVADQYIIIDLALCMDTSSHTINELLLYLNCSECRHQPVNECGNCDSWFLESVVKLTCEKDSD